MNALPPFAASRPGSSAGLLTGGIAVVLLLAFLALFLIRGCRSEQKHVENDVLQTRTPRYAVESTSSGRARNETDSVATGTDPVIAPKQAPREEDEGTIERSATNSVVNSVQNTSGSSADGNTTPGSRAPNTPSDQAVAKARERLRLAHKAAVSGDSGQAFIHARDAWLALKDHQNDAASRGVAEVAFAQMNQYAQQANARFLVDKAGILIGKPLLEK